MSHELSLRSQGIATDSRYTTKWSTRSNTRNEMVIHITKKSVSTALPLQQLIWSQGHPCAFTSESDVYERSQPNWFILERDGSHDTCRDYPLAENGGKLAQAKDTRYEVVSKMRNQPNDYEVKKLSGVLDKLQLIQGFIT